MRQEFSSPSYRIRRAVARGVLALAMLCPWTHGQQVRLNGPNPQVSGQLMNRNGGTGVDTSAATGCPKVVAGTWTFSAANCGGGSPTGTNLRIAGFSNAGGLTNFNFYTDSTYSDLLQVRYATARSLNQQLNSDFYRTGGTSNDGIANTLASTDCTSLACLVTVPPTSTSTELMPTTSLGPVSNGTKVMDYRSGLGLFIQNPINPDGNSSARPETMYVTKALASTNLFPNYQHYGFEADYLTGGNDSYVGCSGCMFKSNYTGDAALIFFHTNGQEIEHTSQSYFLGFGDHVPGNYIHALVGGGGGNNAGEGSHTGAVQFGELTSLQLATCTSCTTGGTTATVSFPGSPTHPLIGDDMWMQDWTLAVASSTTGCYLGTGDVSGTPLPYVNVIGTSCFGQSWAGLATTAFVGSGPGIGAVGTATVTLSSTSLPSGFSSTTTGIGTVGTTGVACVADSGNEGQIIPDYFETATFTVLSSTTLSVTFTHPHANPPVLMVGGPCGHELVANQNVSNHTPSTIPTNGTPMQSVAIMGYVGNVLYLGDYARGTSVGTNGNESEVFYQASTITSATRTSNVTTVVTPDTNGVYAGLPMVISGVSGTGFNATVSGACGSGGVCQLSANSFTYPNTGADGTGAGGTATINLAGFTDVPAVKMRQVMDTATQKIGGVLTLYPNTTALANGHSLVAAMATQDINGTSGWTIYSQMTPRPDGITSGGDGITVTGRPGPTMSGGYIVNINAPLGTYVDDGGTKKLPDAAYRAGSNYQWVGRYVMGAMGGLYFYCPYYGCSTWRNSPVLFQIQNGAGNDSTMTYNLASRALTWSDGFTAQTVKSLGLLTGTGLNLGAQSLGYPGAFGGAPALYTTGGTVPFPLVFDSAIMPANGGLFLLSAAHAINGSIDTSLQRIGAGVMAIGNGGTGDYSGGLKLTNLYLAALGTSTSPVCPNGTGGALTTTGCVGSTPGASCVTSASPAACGSSRYGLVAIPVAGTTLVINDTAVTATGVIELTPDVSTASALGVACSSGLNYTVTARSPGVSFTVTSNATSTNYGCFNYEIPN